MVLGTKDLDPQLQCPPPHFSQVAVHLLQEDEDKRREKLR